MEPADTIQTILGGGTAGIRLQFETDPTREAEIVVIGLGGRKCKWGCQRGRPKIRCSCTTNHDIRREIDLFGQALVEMVHTHRLAGMDEARRGRLTAEERGIEI